MVSANGGMSFAINQTLSLGSGNYTYIAYGPIVSATGLLVSENSLPTPNSGTFNFRAINVAAGIGPVDLYLTPVGTDINTTSPTIAGVAFGDFRYVHQRQWRHLELRATATGTKSVIYDTVSQVFTSGNSYEAVSFTKGSSRSSASRCSISTTPAPARSTTICWPSSRFSTRRRPVRH